jgi:hypothetical protein
MALGSKTMQVAMKSAWAISKVTGISIAKISAITLKTAWKLVGGRKS